jgi:hypothetical protein
VRAKHQDVRAQRAALEQFRSVRIDGLLHKAAVAAGTAHDAGWASEWQDFYSLASEWLIATSARTFLGRLAYRRIPFQTRVLNTPAPDADFVGSGKGIPMAALNLADSTTLKRTTIGMIAAVTNELVQVWRPGTREQLDAVLARSLIRGMDSAALDPDRAAVTGERPASLLNGVDPIDVLSSDTLVVATQVKSMLQALVDGGSDLESALFVMHPTEALTLSTMRVTDGVFVFPQLGAMGGSIHGIPAVTSVGCARSGSPSERVFAVVDGAQVAVADDGEIDVHTSRHADVQMVDVPDQDANDGTGSTVTSFFQTDTTGLKLIRVVNWERLRDSAVAWLTVPV